MWLKINQQVVDFTPWLLSLLAARSAGLLNFSELSRSAQVPQSTLKRYFALLESTFLAHRLPPWSGNLGKRLVRSPKICLNDTGLAAHILGADGADPGEAAARVSAGPLLETFVVGELLKQADWSCVRPRLYHFRTHAGREVDVVLEDARGRCAGIEIKSSASVGSGDFKGLRTMAECLGKRFMRGVVLYAGRAVVPFARNLHALPVGALWEIGAQEAAKK